jgi:hypothetical protein
MKIGIEHRRKTVVAVVLMSVAVLFAGRSFKSQKFRFDNSPASTPDRLVQSWALERGSKNGASLDPTLHYWQLAVTENRLYTGNGRNIFRSVGVTHPSRVPVPPDPLPPALTTEPAASPISLRFFGFALMLDQPRKAFLGEGDSVFVANEGDIVNRRYRVLRIDSTSVVVEDLIEKSVHELDLNS